MTDGGKGEATASMNDAFDLHQNADSHMCKSLVPDSRPFKIPPRELNNEGIQFP